MTVQYVGPFQQWRIVVDGWQVPLLEATPVRGGQVSLTLDHRFGLDLSVSEAERVVPFLAHAIAVAAGFSCHPFSRENEPLPLASVRPRRLTGLHWVESGDECDEGGVA